MTDSYYWTQLDWPSVSQCPVMTGPVKAQLKLKADNDSPVAKGGPSPDPGPDWQWTHWRTDRQYWTQLIDPVKTDWPGRTRTGQTDSDGQAQWLAIIDWPSEWRTAQLDYCYYWTIVIDYWWQLAVTQLKDWPSPAQLARPMMTRRKTSQTQKTEAQLFPGPARPSPIELSQWPADRPSEVIDPVMTQTEPSWARQASCWPRQTDPMTSGQDPLDSPDPIVWRRTKKRTDSGRKANWVNWPNDGPNY